MGGNHMQVLAEQIYNDRNIVTSSYYILVNCKVTYRLLSRLLGVHVNLAKQYSPSLYELF